MWVRTFIKGDIKMTNLTNNLSINSETSDAVQVFSPNSNYTPPEAPETAKKVDLLAWAILAVGEAIVITGAVLLCTGVGAPAGLIVMLTPLVILGILALGAGIKCAMEDNSKRAAIPAGELFPGELEMHCVAAAAAEQKNSYAAKI